MYIYVYVETVYGDIPPVYIYTYIHMHVHIHIHMYVYIYIYTWIYIYVYIYIYTSRFLHHIPNFCPTNFQAQEQLVRLQQEHLRRRRGEPTVTRWAMKNTFVDEWFISYYR